MRLMYDSTDPFAIPTNAPMVAGYIDGTKFKWTDAGWARFPNSVKVRIARRTSTNDGHVLDVESGIPTVWPINDTIIAWVQMRRRAGIEPTIYCNQLNDWEPLKRLFNTAGVAQPQWWVARYDNKKNIPEGAVAKQYANPPLVGFHADASMVIDYWPGVDGGMEDMATADEVWGHSLNFDPNSFPEGEAVPNGGPAWMHLTNANLYATRANAKAEALQARVDDLEAKLDQLLTTGVKVVAEGQIVIKGEAN